MTVVFNAVLIRYEGGYTYVDRSNGHGRRELFLQMGGIADLQLARQLGAQFLALSRDEITTLAEQGEVRALDQVPGLSIALGDRVGDDMLVSLTSALVGDGNVQVTLELGDARRQRIEALNRQLQRAGSGMKSELSAPVIQGQDQGGGSDTTPPAFSQSGPAVVTISPPWYAPRPYHLSWLELGCTLPGGASKVQVLRNGLVVGDAILGADDRRSVTIIDRGWVTGDEMVLALTVAGVGVQDLSATPRGTMI